MPTKIYKTDHDKLDYLESIIMKSRRLETLISNLIDYIIEKNYVNANKCQCLIKAELPDKYETIMNAVNSFVYNYELIIYSL
jgi:hypothetical protein